MTGVDKFVTDVLNLYRQLPETPSKINPNDRKMAIELHQRRIPMSTIESAFLLGSVRRLSRSPDMPPLLPIRSLAYFAPVIQELLDNPISDNYADYLRLKLHSLSGKTAAHKTRVTGEGPDKYVFS
jgi:hypothetical protein